MSTRSFLLATHGTAVVCRVSAGDTWDSQCPQEAFCWRHMGQPLSARSFLLATHGTAIVRKKLSAGDTWDSRCPQGFWWRRMDDPVVLRDSKNMLELYGIPSTQLLYINALTTRWCPARKVALQIDSNASMVYTSPFDKTV